MAYPDPLSPPHAELDGLIAELVAIRAEMVALAEGSSMRLDEVHPANRASARNLLHYLALRRRDLRPLQRRLAALGLSSLGRAEAHVLATVDAVLHTLRELARLPHPPQESPELDFDEGQRLLAAHAEALFGPASPARDARIMVTMPSEAASDDALVRELVRRGMDCMRINCAHDDAPAWRRTIEHLRRSEQALSTSCRLLMDLAGPKLRTGPLEPGPAVVKVRPRRDAYGRVQAPARVWLTAQEALHPPPAPADAVLPLPAAWLARRTPGERLRFTDAREASRKLRVVEVSEGGCWAEATQTAYLVPGTLLRRGKKAHGSHADEVAVGDLPPREDAIELQPGDVLVLTRDLEPGRPARRDGEGRVLAPASIGCTLPEVLSDVRAGEQIWFDDGKIGGVIEQVEGDRAHVCITRTRPGGGKLRGDKGINLPDSRLRLDALTEKDLADLPFIAEHADLVALSFANGPKDVRRLQEHLERLGRRPAIVLKIETRRGFENLPAMLLAAMRAPCCGVMIARGDLAVECGFERLAEVQEEILWVCEAAHVPAIWATQVLEGLSKSGMPSRAEITDAAMGHRAECVMLNKGPHVAEAVEALDDILRRMEAHQAKKSAMLRALHLACAFAPPG